MPKVSERYLEERRNEILDAAFACFRRRGFHQTTMQDICTEAGLSPGAVYRYFKSKEEIISAAFELGRERAREMIEQIRSAEPDPESALDRIGRHFFDHFHEPDAVETARLEVELWSESLRNEAVYAAWLRQVRLLRETFADLIAQSGDVTEEEAKATATLLMAIYNGLQYLKALDPDEVDTDAVYEALTHLLGSAKESLEQRTPVTARTGAKEG